MKRKLSAVFFAVFVAVCASFPALAALSAPAQKVYDYAGLFSQTEIAELEQQAASMLQDTGTDVLILTTADTEGKSPRVYVDDFYVTGGFGAAGYKGIALLIDMQHRELYLYTDTGSMNDFNDDALDTLIATLSPILGSGNYAKAAERFIKDAQAHILYDTLNGGRAPMTILRDSILFGAGITAVVMAVLLAMHKRSFAPAPSARRYLDPKSMQILHQNDQFLTTHTSRRAISTSSGGGSGGSSSGSTTSHRSSSGRSHGGRGGKF